MIDDTLTQQKPTMKTEKCGNSTSVKVVFSAAAQQNERGSSKPSPRSASVSNSRSRGLTAQLRVLAKACCYGRKWKQPTAIRKAAHQRVFLSCDRATGRSEA